MEILSLQVFSLGKMFNILTFYLVSSCYGMQPEYRHKEELNSVVNYDIDDGTTTIIFELV